MGGLKKYYFGHTKIKPNTFIGGVSATITTGVQLATKLGISSSRVSGFRIIGSDIQAKITGGSYMLPSNCFSGDTTITYYLDNDNLLTTINLNGFNGASNLSNVKLEAVTSVGNSSFFGTKLTGTINFNSLLTYGVSAFSSMTSLAGTIINMPNLATSLNSSGLNQISNNVTVNVPLSLKTSNSGAPNVSLSTLLGNTSVIINYIGYTDDASYDSQLGARASSLSNKGVLAQKLGVGSGAIVNYSISGSDIRFKLLSSFSLANNKFAGDSITTFFDDTTGKITGFGALCFNGAVAMNYINTKNCSSIGATAGNDSVFNGLKTGCIITVKSNLATNNAGAPDGDLAYAISSRGATVIYV